MSPTSLRAVALLATAMFVWVGQPVKSQPKAASTAGGVFVGRSGKSMAKTRLFLAEVTGDQEVIYAKIKLPENLPTTVTEEKGQFQFVGVTPGTYAVLYQPPN